MTQHTTSRPGFDNSVIQLRATEEIQQSQSMLNVQWTGFMTIVRKEVTRILRIWPQTLLPSVVTTTLYFLIFGAFIGGRLGEIDGITYIEFIVPGLIMMAVITNAYSNVSSSAFSAKFQRNIEEMLISPLNNSTIVLGFMAGGVMRGVMVGGLVMLVSMLFTPLRIHNGPLIVLTMLFTAILFALGGFINAIYAKNFDQVSIVPTFVLTPLTYLGGVFYTISILPPFWQQLSRLNPVLYLVNIFRYGFLGVSDVPVSTSLYFLIAFTGALWVFCLWVLRRGVGLRT
jgi:ABC-2 type transport system permease protein